MIDLGCELAREHLPKTQLTYNDYMCWEAGKENHRAGALKLLRWVRDNKISVDALGIQSHLGFDYELKSGQHDQWKQFLDDVVAMDYDLLITELDVNDQLTTGACHSVMRWWRHSMRHPFANYVT